MDDTKENVVDEDGKSAISSDLIRGHINTIILRTLYDRDKYGYEIIEEIEKKSHGQYSLKQPTLYSALKRLETQGYINAYWKTDEVSLGGRRKYYTLTDSGREITEKNQSEWEYSRTVIDNLISDRSFDFSQPAPTSVDFKILKKSTSRVPVVKDDDDEDDEEFDEVDEKEEIKDEQKSNSQENKIPQIEIKPESVTFTEQSVIYESIPTAPRQEAPQSAQQPEPVPSSEPYIYGQPRQPEPAPVSAEQNYTQTIRENSDTRVAVDEVNSENKIVREETSSMSEEQKRIVHENFLRLISRPAAEPVKEEVDVVPVADDIDTDKLIYNNKPETERDYRNLINNLFDKTLKRKTVKEPTIQQPVEQPKVKIDDLASKADIDGLKVNSSDYVVDTRKKSYNRGSTLFKSSLIIAVVLLLEFTLCILFKNELGISLAYPFVIFAIAAAQLLIFGVLYYTDIGKTSRKPTSAVYLSACIIVTIILIFLIFIVSILLSVNFASAGDIMAKIIIPCFVALNIPLFAICFYVFSK